MSMPTRRKCNKCGKQRQEKFFTTPRGRVCTDCQRKTRRTTGHANRVETIYGLTRAEYAALLRHQGGRCAICGGGRPYNLDVDHNHAVERRLGMRASIRGLLCRRCNRQLLPAAWGDPAILRAAAAYLENPPASHVLRRKIVKVR